MQFFFGILAPHPVKSRHVPPAHDRSHHEGSRTRTAAYKTLVNKDINAKPLHDPVTFQLA